MGVVVGVVGVAAGICFEGSCSEKNWAEGNYFEGSFAVAYCCSKRNC